MSRWKRFSSRYLYIYIGLGWCVWSCASCTMIDDGQERVAENVAGSLRTCFRARTYCFFLFLLFLSLFFLFLFLSLFDFVLLFSFCLLFLLEFYIFLPSFSFAFSLISSALIHCTTSFYKPSSFSCFPRRSLTGETLFILFFLLNLFYSLDSVTFRVVVLIFLHPSPTWKAPLATHHLFDQFPNRDR